MSRLAREISIIIISDSGADEMLRKMSDPYWFQALGCVLGFDWHSSGVTTTVCGALKDGLRGLEKDLGLFIAGGKGGTSRKTPAEIENFGPQISIDPAGLVYASRMSAKVDSAALQDGYQLYHHCFFFTQKGSWAVVQQGMNEANRYARRYHWLGEGVGDFVCEPHAAICSEGRGEVLNLVEGFSFPADILIWGILLFALGYMMYGALIAGVGVMVPNMKEAGQAQFVVMTPLLIAYLVGLMAPLSGATNRALPVALSYFPLTSPILMIMRITTGEAAGWEVAIAAALILATALLFVRGASRLFVAQYMLSGQPFQLRRYLAAMTGRA